MKIRVLKNKIFKIQLNVEYIRKHRSIVHLEEALHLFTFLGHLDDIAFKGKWVQFLILLEFVFPTFWLIAARLQNMFRPISMFSIFSFAWCRSRLRPKRMADYPSVSLGIREIWYLVLAAVYFKPLRRTIKLFSLTSFTSKC